MPNHVTNIVTFSDKVEEILQFIKGEEEMDFNKIIPMPESLNITSGSSTDNAIAVLKYKEDNDPSLLNKIMEYTWVKNEGVQTLDQLCDRLSVNLDEGRTAIENQKKYGCSTWYDWCCKYWGTKWNAYDTSLLENGVRFQTAWSCPYPVICELAKIFPNVTINVKYADEDTGINCGEFSVWCEDGVIKEEWKFSGDGEIYSQAFAYYVYAGGEGEIDTAPVFIDSLNNSFYKGEFEGVDRLLDLIREHFLEFKEALKSERGKNLDKELLNELIKICVQHEEYEMAGVVNDVLTSHRRGKIERILGYEK